MLSNCEHTFGCCLLSSRLRLELWQFSCFSWGTFETLRGPHNFLRAHIELEPTLKLHQMRLIIPLQVHLGSDQKLPQYRTARTRLILGWFLAELLLARKFSACCFPSSLASRFFSRSPSIVRRGEKQKKCQREPENILWHGHEFKHFLPLTVLIYGERLALREIPPRSAS
jgi:hypothetical protein